MRWAFGSLFPAFGLPAIAAPVAGSSRRMAPFRTTGWPAGRRRLWARSAPPSAVGGVRAVPAGLGGSAHGLASVGVPERVPPICP